MKLSIIVPVYKVEPYLRRCVDSILAQTFRDFEVILVDDGSPDNCGAICDEYAAKDARVKVLHKANGGLSDARNAGLDIAQGEYIGFVDSDDYIAPDMYETLLDLAKRTDADISAVGYIEVTSEESIVNCVRLVSTESIYQREQFLDNYFPENRWRFMASACNKLYKRGLFNEIRFPVGYIYEDSFLQLPLLNQCKIVAASEKCTYFYMIKRESSIMNASFSEKNFQLIDLGYSQYKFYLEKSNYGQQNYALDVYITRFLQVFFSVYYSRPDLKPKLRKYWKEYCELLPKILKNPQTCHMKKLTVLMSHICPLIAYRMTEHWFPECLPPELR